MDAIEFKQWWDEFLQNHAFDKDGFETANHLRRYVRDLTEHKRAAFLDELLAVTIHDETGSGLALEVLTFEAMPRHVSAICAHVTPLPRSGSPTHEATLVAFLRVLAADRSARCLYPVEQFLLVRSIGLDWSALPWSLWPHQPDLFCRAWVRYFTVIPASRWSGTAIVQAFLRHADAISLLKPQLLMESPSAWLQFRDALASQARAPWLSKSEQELLNATIVA